jgi:hypothetical protein
MVEKACITCQTSGNVTKYMTARFHDFSMNIFWDIECVPDFFPTLYVGNKFYCSNLFLNLTLLMVFIIRPTNLNSS